jgi:hypothetical protein
MGEDEVVANATSEQYSCGDDRCDITTHTGWIGVYPADVRATESPTWKRVPRAVP